LSDDNPFTAMAPGAVRASPGDLRPVRRDRLVTRGLLGGLAVVLLHVHFAHRRRPGRGAAKGLEAMLGAGVRGGDALVRKMGARAQRLDAHLATFPLLRGTPRVGWAVAPPSQPVTNDR